MSYLVVVAHPDDEVLGAGATIIKLAQIGQEVNVCILSGKAEARQNRPKLDVLNDQIAVALDTIGVNKTIIGDFPNIAFNTVNHLELVQFIEKAIEETNADVIITHHPADLNNDHFHTSIACQAASKLFQRRSDIKPLNELLFMEILSSSDWIQNPSVRSFIPNVFFEVGEKNVKKKITALSAYSGVLRKYPHPRSEISIMSLAAYRGSQAGVIYAEAFESVFRRVSFER